MTKVPKMESLQPLSDGQLQQIVQTVETLTPDNRQLLVKWLTQMCKPIYARSITKLVTQSPTLVLVSAAALYSAMFSREAGATGATAAG